MLASTLLPNSPRDNCMSSPRPHRPRLPFAKDNYLQSPFKTPSYNSNQSMSIDDSGFDSPTASPLLDISSSRTLYTPVKQSQHCFDEFDPDDSYTFTPKRPPSTAGTKRKSPSTRTPLRQHSLTPLNITSSATGNGRLNGSKFDRLAPLSPPKFHARTPQTKKETEAYIRNQTATMTRLKISDLDASDGSESEADNDSGCDLAADVQREDALFLGGETSKDSRSIFNKALRREGRLKDEEVAEAISPGGHITKRRARRRPLSDELLESVRDMQSTTVSTLALLDKFGILNDFFLGLFNQERP